MEEDFCYISNVTSFAILQGATLALLSTRNFLVCCLFFQANHRHLHFVHEIRFTFSTHNFHTTQGQIQHQSSCNVAILFWAANKGQPTILHIFMGLHNKDIFLLLEYNRLSLYTNDISFVCSFRLLLAFSTPFHLINRHFVSK